MLDTYHATPVPLQAIAWPLLGAALILLAGRLLPRWICRLVALAAAAASLFALWSLRAAGPESIQWSWEPLNLFRLGPALAPNPTGLLVGIIAAACTAAAVLGILGSPRLATPWYGLLLVALAGVLALTMATNLLALALASALIDLALFGITLLADDGDTGGGWPTWPPAVPGFASTLLLFTAALRMDSQIGTASLLAQTIPPEVLVMVAAAGLLRALLFPLDLSAATTPFRAIASILTMNAGLYLLDYFRGLSPAFGGWPWVRALGSLILVAGGLLAWSAAGRSSRTSAGAEGASGEAGHSVWPGLANHQIGAALIAVALPAAPIAWPLIGLTLALVALAVWWDSGLPGQAGPPGRRLAWIAERLALLRGRMASWAVDRLPALARLRRSWAWQHVWVLFPAVALASLGGAPFTAGSASRWSSYATLLNERNAALLLALVMADTFLVAALVQALAASLRRSAVQRPSSAALVALAILAALLVQVGVAPGSLIDELGSGPAELSRVSVWGIGLIYGLPWLVGIWLAYGTARLAPPLGWVHGVVSLAWLRRGLAWIGRRLSGAVYWLGRVGEGEGWWGWALIILALGALFLANR